MKDTQVAKRNMYGQVAHYFAGHAAEYAGNAPLTAAIADLNTLINSLDEAAGLQITVSKGVTADKANKRFAMAEDAVTIASAIRAYAVSNNDPVLEKQFFHKLSYFRLASDTVAFDASLLIHNTALQLGASLAPYQVTAASIAALLTKTEAFSNSISTPRLAISTRKQATAGIVELLRQADSLLRRRIDPLMYFYKSANPAFYNGYRNSRVIIDAPVSSHIRTGTLGAHQDLRLPFPPILRDNHTIRLHNLGNSPITFYRTATGEPSSGITVQPRARLTHTLADLGTGPFLHARNTLGIQAKYWVKINL